MRNVNIAILDDEPLYIEKIREVIDNSNDGRNIEVDGYTSSKELLESECVYDIILVDMELKEYGRNDEGLDFIRAYRSEGKDALMIIVTTHDELARDGYKVKAFDYVFKDKLKEELTAALQSAYDELDDGKSVNFFVIKEEKKDENESIKEVQVKEIRYFETEGRHIRIYLEREDFLVNDTLGGVIEKLKDDRFFITHRSYAVNIRYAVGTDGKELRLKDGQKIPIGRARRNEVKTAYWAEKRRRER